MRKVVDMMTSRLKRVFTSTERTGDGLYRKPRDNGQPTPSVRKQTSSSQKTETGVVYRDQKFEVGIP